LGRVINYLGKPIDGKGDIESPQYYPAEASGPLATERPTIHERIVTGVRAIDGLLAVGKGQRLGIFAGSGVGKSTLLGMIAHNTNADVNVIALVGERIREVNDFIEKDLGPEGLARSVVVVATGEEPALAQLRGAYTATAIAEFFRDDGKDVMFLFDNVTRFAWAQQSIGTSSGEALGTRGYPPSVKRVIQKLLERSGTSKAGTITAFYATLVEGDDMDEPVTDAVRGITDGHVILSRALFERAHFPAIDVLASISRLANSVTPKSEQDAAAKMRRLMANYAANETLINVGAYKQGVNPEIDVAIAKHADIERFLCQGIEEKAPLEETLKKLGEITG
jgi:flagellum-specific ATP synthase